MGVPEIVPFQAPVVSADTGDLLDILFSMFQEFQRQQASKLPVLCSVLWSHGMERKKMRGVLIGFGAGLNVQVVLRVVNTVWLHALRTSRPVAAVSV